MTRSGETIIRYSLGILTLLLALNAFGGGYYGMSGAKNVPVEWLKGSPFPDYFIPSLILFICVGGSSLFASIVVFIKSHLAKKASLVTGIITVIWLSVQMAIIGYVSWMQPATATAAVLILILSWLLPGHQSRNI